MTTERNGQGWRDIVVANPDNAPAKENWVSNAFQKLFTHLREVVAQHCSYGELRG
jgi:hypothetical protein